MKGAVPFRIYACLNDTINVFFLQMKINGIRNFSVAFKGHSSYNNEQETIECVALRCVN